MTLAVRGMEKCSCHVFLFCLSCSASFPFMSVFFSIVSVSSFRRTVLAFGVWAFCFFCPVVRALCTALKQDLHLYVVLETSSQKVKQSKSIQSLLSCQQRIQRIL
ncbi:hypothetical protein AWENTII_008350 [Aspergillus wentii]